MEAVLAAAPFTLVLASDVVWVDELLEPFVRTLVAVLEASSGQDASGHAPVALLSYQERSRATTARLLELLRARLDVSTVPIEDHHPAYRTADIAIYRIRLRSGQSEPQIGAGASPSARRLQVN